MIPQTEPEILSLCELLTSLIAYEDTPIPQWLDLELQAHISQMGKLEKIRFLRELTIALEEHNSTIPKIKLAYLPYNKQYILIAKRSLLATGMGFDITAETLAEKLRVSASALHAQTCQIIAKHIDKLTDDEVDDLVLQIISKSAANGPFKIIKIHSVSA
jgi:hypothetical protein